MLPVDHAFAVLLFAIGPILSSTVGFRRLKNASPDTLPRVRMSVYRTAMLVQWTLTLGVVALWVMTRRGFDTLGLLPRVTAGAIGLLIGLAVIVVLVVRQRRAVLIDPTALGDVRERLRHVEIVLPHSRREFQAFAGLSVTAGICEEVLYRGFLIQYLAHTLALIPAAAVASIAFGLGHAYQGVKGVVLTTAVGAFLSAAYLLSGSLFIPMLMHALMDLHSGHLAWRAYERAAADAAAERAAEERMLSEGAVDHGAGPAVSEAARIFEAEVDPGDV